MLFNKKKYSEICEFSEIYAKKNDILPAKIIAVTKTHPVATVKEAIKGGIKHFGENRVQEAYNKFKDLNIIHKDIFLHMIGSLQTNKVKRALEIFHFFHSLDRQSLALEFSKYPFITQSKLFFIQVNTGKEKQKSGILPNLASEFIQHCIHALKLNVIGLMCLPPTQDDPRPHFLMLKELALKNKLKQLSMGMSTDYKIAVDSGATFIRIGSRFFGDKELTT